MPEDCAPCQRVMFQPVFHIEQQTELCYLVLCSSVKHHSLSFPHDQACLHHGMFKNGCSAASSNFFLRVGTALLKSGQFLTLHSLDLSRSYL